LTASYGHGISVTPLQLTSAVASIVNGGFKVKPTLILETETGRKKTDIRVISQKTSLNMRQLMRLVVTEGTAKKADVRGYAVGGKTGTAEKNLGGRYDSDKRISSFVAAFPMNDPRYVVFIMVDEPKPNSSSHGYATAGWVAAPAAARAISSIAPMLNVRPDLEAADISEPLLQYIQHNPKEGVQ
jgi:cell division protein FtsI (penicillin-binding protein 3)